MPERDALLLRAQHPGGEALLEAVCRARRDPLEQPELGVDRVDGDRLEKLACAGAQPGGPREHRVSHRLRELVSPGGERLA